MIFFKKAWQLCCNIILFCSNTSCTCCTCITSEREPLVCECPFGPKDKLKTNVAKTDRHTHELRLTEGHGRRCFIHTSQASSDGHTLRSWQLRQSRRHSSHQLMNTEQVYDMRWLPPPFITDSILQSVNFGFLEGNSGLNLRAEGAADPEPTLNKEPQKGPLSPFNRKP